MATQAKLAKKDEEIEKLKAALIEAVKPVSDKVTLVPTEAKPKPKAAPKAAA